MLFSEKIIQAVESRIEERVVSVQNHIERKHPVLPYYKAADSKELTRTLLNILLTLSDDQKQEVIDTIAGMKSKIN